jgi:hypothetical protein
MEYDGNEYDFVIGSDVVRDGMFAEISDQSKAIIEIFYSDSSHKMTVTLFEPNLPLEVIEWAIAIAHERLLPNQ